MTVAIMRMIDRFAGIPLCWLAGMWIALFRRKNRQKAIEKWNTILVMKFFGMGSILLSTPFLTALRRQFPEAQIIFLTFDTNRELLAKLSTPDIKLTIATNSFKAFFKDTLSVIRALRSGCVDVVFDLEFFSKFSTLISVISGAAARVGYDLPARWRRSNITVPVSLDHSAHVVQTFCRQLEACRIPAEIDGTLQQLLATHAEDASMERKLNIGTNGFEIICVNINAGSTSLERRWAPERFAEVVLRMMHESSSRKFVFIGSFDERNYVQELLDEYPLLRPVSINSAGQLSIGELIALFQRASVLLTNDSGPMHIAASTGTPVVALFGPESPQFYGPLGRTKTVYKAIGCSPCLNIYNAKLFVCPYNARCMHEISTGEVLAAINSITAPIATSIH